MSFDEIQAIWDSQQTPNDLGGREQMVAAVVARERSFNRIATATDVAMSGTLLFVAAMFFRDPLLQGHDLVLILPGIVSLIAAGLIWFWRISRKRRQSEFDDSLPGLLNKSIDSINDRVTQMSRFLWWFACPNLLGLGIALVIVDESKRFLIYGVFLPAFLICIGLAQWQIRREIRLKLQPEIDRLMSLLAQVADESASE